jgi:WD40 repeat protein
MIMGGTHFCHWDIDRGKQIRRFPEQDAVRSVAFGPGGKTLATADGMTLRLWEAATGRERRQFRGQHAPVDELAISPDGTIIAAGDDEGTIIVWDATTGREIRRGGDKTERPSIAFAPDGKTYAVSDKQGARLWDTDTGKVRRRLEGHTNFVYGISVAPDGKTMASASADGTTLIWDVTKVGE